MYMFQTLVNFVVAFANGGIVSRTFNVCSQQLYRKMSILIVTLAVIFVHASWANAARFFKHTADDHDDEVKSNVTRVHATMAVNIRYIIGHQCSLNILQNWCVTSSARTHDTHTHTYEHTYESISLQCFMPLESNSSIKLIWMERSNDVYL